MEDDYRNFKRYYSLFCSSVSCFFLYSFSFSLYDFAASSAHFSNFAGVTFDGPSSKSKSDGEIFMV